MTATLPAPFAGSHEPLDLVTQGAEAFLFRTTFLDSRKPCALKYRPPKPYRHATLDKRLTRQRILAEARVLARCRLGGIDVPGVLGLDWEAGWLATEWVEGPVIRHAIQTRHRGRGEKVQKEGDDDNDSDLTGLLQQMGVAIAKLHAYGIVHGDLTTSNMMLRPQSHDARSSSSSSITTDLTTVDPETSTLQGQVVLIDFGLAQQTSADEDRAVDLYVLERAFGSTHPEAEHMFHHLIDAYSKSYPGAKVVIRRLVDVRMRGRKKSMLG